MMFAPKWAPFRLNIWELSYWARVCTVPLAVLADQRKVVPVAPEQGISELYPAPPTPGMLYDYDEQFGLVSWKNLFLQADKAFKKADQSGEITEIFNDKERVFALSAAYAEEQRKPVLLYAGTGVYKLSEMESAAQIVESVAAGYREAAGAELPAFA